MLDRPNFLAEVHPVIFYKTVGFPRFKFGPDTLDNDPQEKKKAKFTFVNGNIIRLESGKRQEKTDVRPNPEVRAGCRLLRDSRVALGRALYVRREVQYETAFRRTKKVLKRNARARQNGETVVIPSRQPSPLKQTWAPDTMKEEYDNSDPWTVPPGEGFLYSNHRLATPDNDIDTENVNMNYPVGCDAVEQDLAQPLDAAHVNETTVLQTDEQHEILPLEEEAPGTTSRKRKADDEEAAQRSSKKQCISLPDIKTCLERQAPQVSNVGPAASSYITPPSSQDSAFVKVDCMPILDFLAASEAAKRLKSLTANDSGGRILSALAEHTEGGNPATVSSQLSASPPQLKATALTKKRKACDDIDQGPVKQRRNSAERDGQFGAHQLSSSGLFIRLPEPLSEYSSSSCATVDGQHREHNFPQAIVTSSLGRAARRPIIRGTLFDHQSRKPPVNTAHLLSPTGPSSVTNSAHDDLRISQAPSSHRIWYRCGWSCNLH
jgi:hypothetical protein